MSIRASCDRGNDVCYRDVTSNGDTISGEDRVTGGEHAAPGSGRCEATCQEVIMPLVRVRNFSVSLDGFGTGEGQSLDAPARACGAPAA